MTANQLELAANTPAAKTPARVADTPASVSSSLVQMIERVAFDPTVDIDRMDKLLTFLTRVKAAEAEAAFTSDFSAMQPSLPSIDAKGRIVHNNKLIANYAKWEDVNEVLKPALAAHNFVLNFNSAQDEKSITVTAVLKHTGGHQETAQLRLPLDTSGAKNAVQAIGSTISYGKRYAAGLVLNLTSRAPGEADDDGRAAGAGEPITEAQVREINKRIATVGADVESFCAYLKVDAVAAIPASQYERAIKALDMKAAKAKEPA